jgi:hypothetical protein
LASARAEFATPTTADEPSRARAERRVSNMQGSHE